MTLRDDTEAILRRWDAHERNRGAAPIIDFDFLPTSDEVVPAGSRLEVLEQLDKIRAGLGPDRDRAVLTRITADLAYLRALIGERTDLATYVQQTQACATVGWPSDYVVAVGDLARKSLGGLGVPWNDSTTDKLSAMEGKLATEDAATAIQQAAAEYEPTVRDLVGSTAPYELTIETVNLDAYWAYWLDGAGTKARLRFNLRHAAFTAVAARQFALHEILGHALQGASLAQRAGQDDVPWVRFLSVHAPQQVLFEGLAQALPLFVAPHDEPLVARVRMGHYTQLVRAELHLAINAGTSVVDCAAHARERVPFWTDADIADALSDRSNNPQLRSYLWAYPAGIDWFVRLADDAPHHASKVMTAAYRDPLTPDDLTAHWPDGPAVGGGASSRP